MEAELGGPSAHNRGHIPGRQIREKIAAVGTLSARGYTHFAGREIEVRKMHIAEHVHLKVHCVLADSTG